MNRNYLQGFRGIGYYLLKYAFPIVYALTVTPFTVQLFRRFVTPPDGSVLLFNLVPLAKVHTFALPLFVLALELLSIQIAKRMWQQLFVRQLTSCALTLLLLICFQAIPVFSTFYHAETTELDKVNKQSSDRAAAIQQVNDSRRADLEMRIGQLSDEVAAADGADGAIDRLQRSLLYAPQYGVDGAGRQEIQRELQQAMDKRNRDETELSQARSQLADVRNTQQRSAFVPETDMDYLRRSFGSSTANLFLFISFVFPVMVIGAGLVLAQQEDPPTATTLPLLSSGQELAACGRMPQRQQQEYAADLCAVIEAHLNALRASQRMSRLLLAFNIRTDDELKVVENCSALLQQVRASGVSGAAQATLVDFITRLLSGEPQAEAAETTPG